MLQAAWGYVGRSWSGGAGGGGGWYLEQGNTLYCPLLLPNLTKWKSPRAYGFITAHLTGSEWLTNCSYLNKNNTKTFSFLPPLPGLMTLKGFVTSHEPWENKPWWIPIHRDNSEGMCPLLPARWKTTVLARTGRGAIHSSLISQIVSQEMVLVTLKWTLWGFSCARLALQSTRAGQCPQHMWWQDSTLGQARNQGMVGKRIG